MAGVQKLKSEETRRRVLEAAASVMREKGIDAVQIREVASGAGYSVGSVYKHFPDRDALIIAVNVETLKEIRARLTAAVGDTEGPLARLKALAHAYLAYAEDQANAWRGLFAHQLPQERCIPEELRQENIHLLALIAGALKDLHPEMGEADISTRTRTCFGAMHGLVSIALERRFVAVGTKDLASEMDYVVERLCS